MRTLHLAALAVMAFLVAISPALGQGTSGQIPDPISTASLRSLLSLYVRPSPAEWETIESLHDDYREAFRQLREGDIETFLTETRAMQQAMPSKRTMEDFFRKYDRVNKRIEQIDGTLFDGIAVIVGDERRSGVDRARDARARQRFSAGMMGMSAGVGGRADVAAIALEIELSPEERAAIDPALVSYERSLTGLLRNLNEQTQKGFLQAFDEMEKLGLGGMSQDDLMADPERMQQVMEAMQAAFRSVGERSGKIAGDITELNGRTYRTVHGQLAGDDQRRFRVRYLRDAYPELSWSDQAIERIFRSALRLRSIDVDTKTRVQQVYDQWRQADDAIVDEGMRTLDDFNRNRSPFDFDPTVWESHNTTMQALYARRGELSTKSRNELQSLLGPETLQKLTQFVSNEKNVSADPFSLVGDPEADEVAEFGVAVRAEPAEEIADPMWSGADPPAIGIGFVAVLADRLQLDPGGRAVLETLHGDYLKEWEEKVKPLFAEARAIQGRIWRHDAGALPRPDQSAQNDWFARLGQATAAARSADDELFADALKAIGDAHAKELAVARLERILDQSKTSGAVGFFGFPGVSERLVNVPEILKRAGLPPEQEQAAIALIAEKAPALIEAQSKFAAQALDTQRRIQDLSLRMQTMYQDSQPTEEGSTPSAESMRRIQELSMEMMRIQGENEALFARQAAELRATYAAAIATLPESARPALELAYEEAAYPGIFRDELSAMPFIEKASGFSDLTADQRARIDALRSDYGAAYLEFCRRMIPAREEAGAATSKPEERFADQMRRGQEAAKVRFERDERSARAVSQLQRILTDDQLRRIPGLDAYENRAKARNNSDFFVYE